MELDKSQALFEVIADNKHKPCARIYLKSILLFPIVLMVIILAGAFFLAIISPRLKIKEFNELYNQYTQTSKKDPIAFDNGIYILKKQEAFLRSKLAKSDLDSISLSINIPDSILSLEIKGVSIYNVKIDYIRLSPLFDCFDRKALVNCLSSPFTINNRYATIVKEPIIIKKAPKDTIEANQLVPNIDTLKPKMVAYYFYLDKDIILDIRQSEKTELIPYLKYSVKYNYWWSMRRLKEIFHLRLPDYIPWIQIKINCKDALAIYRALPENAIISIHL
jgi:hypothetical protein